MTTQGAEDLHAGGWLLVKLCAGHSRPMGKAAVLGLILAAVTPAQSLSVAPRAVEQRYNRLRSLTADFAEAVSYGGRNRRQERGRLYLLRPGKMRWEYTQPAGKLFVADGKAFHLYSPHANQVQRIKPRESDDLRAPLAFLLGRLDFGQQFGKLRLRATADGIELEAEPRTGREVFERAVFTIQPQSFAIRRIVVRGLDGLITEFWFSSEVLNPALEARLFRFEAPAGAELVEAVP